MRGVLALLFGAVALIWPRMTLGILSYEALKKLGQVEMIRDVERFVQAKQLGPDALGSAVDEDAFLEILAGRRGMVKSALMAQELLAGIGNVYSDEILFQAGFTPGPRSRR
jgi:formamidopyrimidine-DNA glycosylase